MKTVKLLAIFSLMIAFCSCATTIGGTKFPEPSPGFNPKRNYTTPVAQILSAIETVCDENRIITESVSPKKIATEYIQGQSQMTAGGLGGTISTRYKYTVLLKTDNDVVKVNIICKLESSGNAMQQWRDISNDNPEVIRVLENWFYEQIETKIAQ